MVRLPSWGYNTVGMPGSGKLQLNETISQLTAMFTPPGSLITDAFLSFGLDTGIEAPSNVSHGTTTLLDPWFHY